MARPRLHSEANWCAGCDKVFYRPNGMALSRWNSTKFCSRKCKQLVLFWEKVNVTLDGCWEWTAALYNSGGAYFHRKNDSNSAYRFSFELHYGEIDKDLFVCHKCDNRKCVRPDHLFLGTCQDNMTDAVNKGRTAKGEVIKTSKLTSKDVLEIKALLNQGYTREYIASLFNVHHSNITYIATNKIWKHIDRNN